MLKLLVLLPEPMVTPAKLAWLLLLLLFSFMGGWGLEGREGGRGDDDEGEGQRWDGDGDDDHGWVGGHLCHW